MTGERTERMAGGVDQTWEPSMLEPSPLAQLGAWLADATDAGLPEPNAMVLASVAPDGQPSTRTVLCKGIDDRGLAFFTNLGSRKGVELAARPVAAATFPWYAIRRQVTAIGDVVPLARAEVEAYFVTRPRDSQLAAWASQQSSVLADRAQLEDRVEQVSARFAGADVPVPEFWGGWILRPRTLEFWSGRPSRLHDRLRYRALVDGAGLGSAADWTVERLSP